MIIAHPTTRIFFAVDYAMLAVSLALIIPFTPFLFIIALYGIWIAPMAFTVPLAILFGIWRAKRASRPGIQMAWLGLPILWAVPPAVFFVPMLFGYLGW